MNTEEIILINLKKIAQQKEINLTYTHKVFFIRLLDYVMKNGEELNDRYITNLTEKEMSEIFGFSLRMITQSIQVLTKIGVIERISVKERCTIYGVNTNIYKSVIEQIIPHREEEKRD